ncbi:ParB/RepB/Spo0J family partition protein [Candidatus Bathyarchaeota archaeon]|nr:ParB/RepB/Spo0J family partition protein [Candidatus Bathyarchaeota archaeon]
MPEIEKIPLDRITVTRDNPRREFDEEKLRELGESIRRYGLLQPIMVRPKNGNYELIIGERRVRACKLIGLTEIDARVVTIDDSTSMELRLIENTHRADLTDAEKGDAVYTLIEHFSDRYPTIKDVADAIRKPLGTVKAWTRKSERLAESVREFVGAHKLTEKSANYLLKYDHDTQFKLANIAVNYPLSERQAIKFFKLYEAKPSADLNKLAEEAKGIKRVEVELGKLSKEGRKEVEAYLERREKEAIEARKRTIKQTRETRKKLGKKIWKSAEVSLRPKVEKLTEKLGELEPEQRQEVAEAIGRRLDIITKSVDKETLEWMKKWETEIAPRIKEETPERYARSLENVIHGVWVRIWVEYPQSVKEMGRKHLVSSLSLERLERLQNTIRITLRELDEFRNVVESELLTKKHKKV